MLTFDTATLENAGEVDALLAETYPALLAADYPPDVLEPALPFMTKSQAKLLTSGSYYIARDTDGLAVAAGGWTPYAPGPKAEVTPELGHIRHVVTRLGRTGEGIGRGLMAHILAQANAAGMEELEALSTLTAMPFYAACGFRVLEEFNVDYGGVLFPSLRMRRNL